MNLENTTSILIHSPQHLVPISNIFIYKERWLNLSSNKQHPNGVLREKYTPKWSHSFRDFTYFMDLDVHLFQTEVITAKPAKYTDITLQSQINLPSISLNMPHKRECFK